MYTTAFIDLPLEELLVRVQTLKHERVRFVQLCAEMTGADDAIDLLYSFYDEATDAAVNYVVHDVRGREVPSIQGLYFAAFSYENETHDLFGVRFANMELDFGGHFFNLAATEPMTIISPEQKAAREKAAKLKAAAAAKAAKAAEAARKKAEEAAAAKALVQDAAQADAEVVAKAAATATGAGGAAAGGAEAGAGSRSGSDAESAAPAPRPASAKEVE